MNSQENRKCAWIALYLTPCLIIALLVTLIVSGLAVLDWRPFTYIVCFIIVAHIVLAFWFDLFKATPLIVWIIVFIIGPLVAFLSAGVLLSLFFFAVWLLGTFLSSRWRKISGAQALKNMRRLVIIVGALTFATWAPAMVMIRNKAPVSLSRTRVYPVLPFLVLSCNDKAEDSGECSFFLAYGIGAQRLFHVIEWGSFGKRLGG